MVATMEELEGLAERIMSVSVKAQFLGMDRVVDALDAAFSDVVREAEVLKRRVAVETMVEEQKERGGVTVGS